MNTKLFIGSEQADFNGSFNVQFSIGNIKDLSFGNANKSYTLNLPLTRTNKRLLKFLPQVDVRTEPGSLGRLYLGESLIISGRIYVNSYSESYADIIIGADDWIDDLKEKKMTALDLSASNHALTNANVLNSWSASYPVYRYPMIDFGGLMSGETNSTATWYPNDFIPAISVASLISKILSPSTIISTWLASSYVKDLYILGRETVLPETFVNNKKLEVYVGSSSDNYSSGSSSSNLMVSVVKDLVFSSETSDEAAAWSSNYYTVPESGTYKFSSTIILVNTAYGNPLLNITDEDMIFSMTVNGTTLYSIDYSTYSGTELLDGKTYTLTSGYCHLNAGDVVKFNLYARVYVTVTSGTQTVTVYTGIASNVKCTAWGNANRYPGLNKTIVLKDLLPDMTQLDFLAAIRDISNLRFWKDNAKNNIYIEPWDSFVSSTVIDLTNYIDASSISTEMISPNYAQNINLRWKDDGGDKAFEEYYKATTSKPGEKAITLTSNQAKPEILNREHQFTSILTGYNQTLVDYSVTVPRIYAETPIYPFMAFNRMTGFNTRIVHWDGLTSGLTWNYDGTTKTTYPKISPVSWVDLYSSYWQKAFHYIDRGKIYTMKVKVNPRMLNQFFTVVSSATSEAFRPTYKATVNGKTAYFFLQKITTDGNVAELELVLKQ